MAIGWSNRFILSQDERVVVTPTPADSFDACADIDIEADRATTEFRQRLASQLPLVPHTFRY